MDRLYDHEIRSKAVFWLYIYEREAAEVGRALRGSRLVNVARDEAGTFVATIASDAPAHLLTLAHATRSITGAEMPGPLDRAFEYALPGHEWPRFQFRLVRHLRRIA